jgi:hypothetical protein
MKTFVKAIVVSGMLLSAHIASASIETQESATTKASTPSIGLQWMLQGQMEKANEWYSEASPFEQIQFAQQVETAFLSYCAGAPQCATLTLAGATVCNNFRPTCYWVR